jgi:hypothetical protein
VEGLRVNKDLTNSRKKVRRDIRLKDRLYVEDSFSVNQRTWLYRVVPADLHLDGSHRELHLIFQPDLLWKVVNSAALLAVGALAVVPFEGVWAIPTVGLIEVLLTDAAEETAVDAATFTKIPLCTPVICLLFLLLLFDVSICLLL